MKRLRTWLTDVTGGAPLTPLLVLFTLNSVDELDQVTFGIVAPEIRDTFGVSETTVTSIGALAAATVIMLVVPVGFLADRTKRVRLVSLAALAWGSMTILTGLSGFVGAIGLLFLARFGAGLGRVMNEPVHVSLIGDYYPPATHGRVFSVHRMANPIGSMFVLGCGALADLFGWRVAFMLLSIPTVIAAVLLSRLEEPVRGASLDLALARQADAAAEPIPFTEAWRRLKAIPTLKRSWLSAFFLGAAIVPIAVFFNFFFEQEYGVESATARGAITMLYSVGSIFGLVLGSRFATRIIMAGEPARLAVAAGRVLGLGAIGLLGMATAPWLGLSILFVFTIGIGVMFNSFALPLLIAVCPPRLRSQGLGYFVFFIGLGAIVVTPIVSGIGESSSYRIGISLLSILLLLSAAIYASASRFVQRDAEQAFATLLAEGRARDERAAAADGKVVPLLTCKGVEVAYDSVQVLFGVDLEVAPGECVALLGTNGAGKSTLLRAIAGLTDPMGGTIFLDGRDITHTEAQQCAALGIVVVPGGRAVFPTLTVAEHFRAAGWLYRDDAEYLDRATEEVLDIFPRLRERIDQQAGNLSGGEQQMLALGMAFVAKPRLLMIDELSLGLAPTVVELLLGIVRRIQAEGTAIVLVEQSINVALTVADRAYFLEKGEVRFAGPTAELLDRDDIVRSVFLAGAAVAPKEIHAALASDAPGDAPLLVATELVKRFGGIRAVDGVSLTLHRNEVLGIIGPNGAGKTTVFDLLSGFLKPDMGRIVLDGVDITEMAPDRRAWLGLGRSFQDARLVPSLTVAENLALGLERHLEVRDHVAALLGLPGVARQEDDIAWSVADLVELLGLGAYRSKFVRELSTGTRRIVDLGMCIAHEPSVLLLDEPSSGIAQRETEALAPVLQRIAAETGCSLLVIEHDMPLISAISDRLIALELGANLAEGTPAEVLSDPQVIAAYLGGDPATIARSDGTAVTNGKGRRGQLTASGRSKG